MGWTLQREYSLKNIRSLSTSPSLSHRIALLLSLMVTDVPDTCCCQQPLAPGWCGHWAQQIGWHFPRRCRTQEWIQSRRQHGYKKTKEQIINIANLSNGAETYLTMVPCVVVYEVCFLISGLEQAALTEATRHKAAHKVTNFENILSVILWKESAKLRWRSAPADELTWKAQQDWAGFVVVCVYAWWLLLGMWVIRMGRSSVFEVEQAKPSVVLKITNKKFHIKKSTSK